MAVPHHQRGEKGGFLRSAVPTIGRVRELDAVRRVVAESSTGSTRVLLFSGDAGIGKTRLLAETADIVRSEGGRNAIGQCLDETGMPPFLPWIDIGAQLAALTSDDSPATSIVNLLLDQSDRAPEGYRHNPEARRLRLYGAICSLLADLARDSPLCIAFDDLQWSDAASNQLLRYIASHLRNSRLLIAGAYRSSTARENPELSRTIGEFEHLRILTEIPLRGLSEDSVEQMVDKLSAGLTPGLVDVVKELSSGNPFAIEEAVRSMLDPNTDGGDDEERTASVADFIMRRFRARTASCRSTLEIAAIGGRDIVIDEISTALDRDPESIMADLEEAVPESLVARVDQRDETTADYRFVHDRVREVIHGSLSAVKTRLLHAKFAAALEAVARDQTPAQLARLASHLAGARQSERAAQAYRELGSAAAAVNAFDAAAAAYDKALQLGSPDDGTLSFALGDVRLRAGHSDAIDALNVAKRLYRQHGDRHGIARTLHLLGVARTRREEHDLAVASFESAAAEWSSIADDVSEVGLISTRTEMCSVLATSLGRYEEAQVAGAAALVAATRSGSRPDLEANARLALANARIRGGDLAAGRGLLEPALALAIRSRQTDLAAEIAGTLANYSYWIGDLPGSERFALRRRELGRESNDPYTLRHTLPWLANVAMARGDWENAHRLIAEAEEDLKRIDSPEPRAFLRQLTGILALQQGRLDEAIPALEEAIAGFRAIGPATLPWYLGVLARAYLAAGELAAMERTAAETVALVSALPVGSLPQAPSIAQLGIIAVRTEDQPAMRRWRTELQVYKGHFHWVLMDRVLGMLAIGLGDQDAAVEHLTSARETAASGQIRPELLRVEGELLLMTGSSEKLDSVLAEMRLLKLADADYIEQRARFLTTPAATVPAGLSAREVDVLILVAGGKTNREIATILSISEKTVTNHLTHVFTKANLENRAAAAAFALRHGLIK